MRSSRRPAIGGVAVVLIVVVMVVAAGAAYLYGKPPTSTTEETIQTLQQSSTTYAAGAVSAVAASTTAVLGPNVVQVEIPLADAEPGTDGTNQFNPQVITLVIGVNNTVTWTNFDEWPHNILTTSGFSSPDLATGQSYTFTFTQVGTYYYICSYFPIMNGKVIVKLP